MICLDLYKEHDDSFFAAEIFGKTGLCSRHKEQQESGTSSAQFIHPAPRSTKPNHRIETKTDHLEDIKDMPKHPSIQSQKPEIPIRAAAVSPV